MTVGRPREYDREKIAHDLIEWAKKPDSLNLNKFCAYNDPIISPLAMLRWCREDEQFRIAYEKAKAFLAFRREEKLNNNELHVKAFDLNASVYDNFLKEDKQDAERFKAQVAAEQAQNYSKDESDKFDAVMTQLKEIRKST